MKQLETPPQVNPEKERHEGQKTTAQEYVEFLTFRIENEEFCFDIKYIKEIIPIGEITMVPRAPETVKGILSLRGNMIPISDLREKLGFSSVLIPGSGRIVVTFLDNKVVGFIVDAVVQVVRVKPEQVKPPPPQTRDSHIPFATGVIHYNSNHLITVLDLETVMRFVHHSGEES